MFIYDEFSLQTWSKPLILLSNNIGKVPSNFGMIYTCYYKYNEIGPEPIKWLQATFVANYKTSVKIS